MRYAFGEYLLDTARYELYHTGRLVPLRPKVLEVLAYLVVHHDRVVTKQELLARLWPDQVVGEDGLKAYIMAVRQALGDRGPAPRLLRTVRGRGYRLVAPVTMPDAVSASPPPPSPLPGPVQDRAEPAAAPVRAPALPASAPGVPPAPAPLPLSAERKVVTVLVCALAEATTPAESLEPEALHSRRQAFLAQAVEAVQQYGGTLQRVLDDGCVALFGAPVAHEDHALRAVLTATRLHQQLRTAAAVAEPCNGQALTVRIGLHTGPVVVGPVRDHQMLMVTAVGETLQLAMELQHLASPGTTLLSETTMQRVRDAVDVAAWHPPSRPATTTVPVAYQVLTVRPQRPALGARVQRVLSRFVGRQHEFTVLQTLWAQVASGRGQVVGVVGHPGIGKSRLLYELRQRLGTTRVTYLHGRCVSYGVATPYLPLLALLRHACQITAEDHPEAIAAKVHQQLRAVGLTPEEAAPYVLLLLGVAVTPNPLTTHSPQVVRARTIETLVQICLHSGRQRPLLLEVEDLHWVDASSQECLAALVDRLAGVPVLLLVTARPGYRPPWMDKSYATQMVLQPLSAPESQTVFQMALGTTALPQALVHSIVQKAEGNPFFLEEFARVVVEHGGQSSALAVPETVQAVLAARIDRLPPEAKRLLQLAAVMGREVMLPLLQEAAGLPAEALHLCLGQLQAAEFLYETRLLPAVAYTFQHALTQEVAYASLVQRTRQQLHAHIAQVLEARFPAMVQAQPELLAQHYTAAGLGEQALPYWQRAGQQALERVACVEAVSHFTQGLELLRTLPDTPERHQQELTLCLTMGTLLLMLKGLNDPEVAQFSTRTYALAQQWGDSRQRLVAVWGLASVYLGQGRLDAFREIVAPVLALAQQEHDRALLPVAHFMMGVICFHCGEFPAARRHLEQGRTLCEPQYSSSLTPVLSVDLLVMCYAREAWTVWMLGDADQAVALSQHSLARAQELGHPPSLAYACVFAALLQQCLRDVRRVLAHTDTAMALAREYHLSYFHSEGLWLQAWTLVQQGGVENGLTQLQQAIRTRVATEGAVGQPYILAHLAEAYGQAGQPEEGLRVAAEALALGERHGERWYTAELYRLQGELVLQQAQSQPGPTRMVTAAYETAEKHFQQAHAMARQQQARFLELRAVMSLSRLWHLQGNTTAARALLAATFQTFTEGFETPDLCSARAFLNTLQQA